MQTFLTTEIKKIYTNAKFVAEEIDNIESELYSELVFVIDPLDGTTNYVKDLHHSCISVACFLYGKPMLGIVYDPYVNEMFYATKGSGAYLNDMRIYVSSSPIADSLVLFGTSPYDEDMIDDTLIKIRRLYPHCLDVRRLGSAALDICYVACGRAALYFESKISLWDYAAASVILSEAGGSLYNYSGKAAPFTLSKTSVIAGSTHSINESNKLGLFDFRGES